MPVTITVHNRTLPSANKATSSPFPLSLTFDSAPTLQELKAAVHAKFPKLTPARQRITTEDKKPLLDERAAVDVPASSPLDLYVKDLGPQIGWRTVFLTEYFGPLFIHPLFYVASQRIYGPFEFSSVQEIALGLVLLHYLKREWETVFVHRFSSGTMPLFNLFKNSAHYWVLSGFLLAPAIYRPALGKDALRGTIQESPVFLTACAVAWTLAQLGNLKCHLILRSLRSEGGRERKIPRGFAFELVVSIARERSRCTLAYPGTRLTLTTTARLPAPPTVLPQLLLRGPLLDRLHAPHLFARSAPLLPRVRRTDGHLGAQEAQELQEGVWKGVPQGQKGHVPLCSLRGAYQIGGQAMEESSREGEAGHAHTFRSERAGCDMDDGMGWDGDRGS